MNFEGASENIIAGRNPVTEALKSGAELDTIYINGSGGSLNIIRRLAREKGVVVKDANDKKLSQLSGGASHQGVVAVGACGKYVTPEEILNISAQKGTKPFIIICDEIEDPHNLGAIIRTAETAGADGIIIPKRRSVGLTPVVAKASAGAIEHLSVARVTNLVAAMEQLKEAGLWIYAADMDGTPYDGTDLTGAVALVVGNEGSGVSHLVREKCDFVLSIPQYGAVNSLNVSNATAILVCEIARQRHRR